MTKETIESQRSRVLVNNCKMNRVVILLFVSILGLSLAASYPTLELEKPSKRIAYYGPLSVFEVIRSFRTKESRQLKQVQNQRRPKLRELKLRGILASKLLINAFMSKF